jgi:hypothetical protein
VARDLGDVLGGAGRGEEGVSSAGAQFWFSEDEDGAACEALF